MRELTYSQGVVVDDPVLLATLCVFCDKIWLPYDRVGDAVQDVLTDARPEVAEALRRDPTRNRIAGWEAQYADLFKDRALQRLPGPSQDTHQHRNDFTDRSVEDVVG